MALNSETQKAVPFGAPLRNLNVNGRLESSPPLMINYSTSVTLI